MVTVILPAHNEEKIIKKAIESLLNQSYWNTEIIICLDNCTDGTEQIINDNFADNYSVKVFKSVENKNKKAGALNQLFSYYFKSMGKYILVMDADTILHHNAIFESVKFLNINKSNGAVCSSAGLIKGEKTNLLWQLQNIEYGLSDSVHQEKQGNIFCCRGMYSMYRKCALNQIIKERKFLFDNDSITEDYELTLMLKKYNWEISSNKKIKAYTDVPLTIKELWIQRIRWTTGGFLDLINHKLKKYTRNDIFAMLFYLFIVFFQVYLIMSSFFVGFSINFYLIALNIILLWINNLLRMKYIQYKDYKTYLILFTVILQLFSFYFDVFVMIVSFKNVIFRKNLIWR
jgi:cellulose synthase/poly-beta-1,6-N-acetylglucosamine synthase-like glycosyltransferase